jgi:hypothetical protein
MHIYIYIYTNVIYTCCRKPSSKHLCISVDMNTSSHGCMAQVKLEAVKSAFADFGTTADKLAMHSVQKTQSIHTG